MKLLLILPRNERGFWGKVRNGKAGMVRLGLPVLAALTPPEWEVEILDARAAEVDYSRPADLVGITAFTAESPSAYAIADGFRARGVPVVMGGIHATALPEEALQHADAVVAGEAEGVWGRVLADAQAGCLRGVYRAPAPCDMRGMPAPRRELLDRKMYVTGYHTAQATRGCPFDCEYCAVTGMFGRKFRTRPIGEVIDEIRTFDSREFFFVDDNICGNPAYAKELFAALKPLKKLWGAQTSITFSRDDELLRGYADAGGSYAFIGFETIAEKSLAEINKSWNRAGEYAEAIRKIHRAGINILGSFIFGLDTDDASVFDATLDFIDRTGIDAAQFHILTPFPGTRLFDKMKADGRLLSEDWARYHTGEVIFRPLGMTAQELEDGFFRTWRNMYTLPRLLRRIFRSYRGLPTRIALNFGYRNKARRMSPR